MTAHIKIQPGNHVFRSEGTDAILDAGVHTGALNYGCAKGKRRARNHFSFQHPGFSPSSPVSQSQKLETERIERPTDNILIMHVQTPHTRDVSKKWLDADLPDKQLTVSVINRQ